MQLKIIYLFPKVNYFGAFGSFIEAFDLYLTSVSGLSIPTARGFINGLEFYCTCYWSCKYTDSL